MIKINELENMKGCSPLTSLSKLMPMFLQEQAWVGLQEGLDDLIGLVLKEDQTLGFVGSQDFL